MVPRVIEARVFRDVTHERLPSLGCSGVSFFPEDNQYTCDDRALNAVTCSDVDIDAASITRGNTNARYTMVS